MEKLWAGSQTKMAADLGPSQGTIANVLAGRRKPGRTLLSALAAHPLINDQWLRDATGPPLLPEATTPAGEAALPIAHKPFVGVPEENPGCLAEELYPVSRRLHRRSRYWVHLDAVHHPCVKDPKLPLRLGDWLLMEPDASNWPESLHGLPCLTEIKLPDKHILLFCRGEKSTANSKSTYDFDFLGQLPDAIKDASPIYYKGRLKRDVVLDDAIKTEGSKLNRLPVKVVAVGIHRCGDL